MYQIHLNSLAYYYKFSNLLLVLARIASTSLATTHGQVAQCSTHLQKDFSSISPSGDDFLTSSQEDHSVHRNKPSLVRVSFLLRICFYSQLRRSGFSTQSSYQTRGGHQKNTSMDTKFETTRRELGESRGYPKILLDTCEVHHTLRIRPSRPRAHEPIN